MSYIPKNNQNMLYKTYFLFSILMSFSTLIWVVLSGVILTTLKRSYIQKIFKIKKTTKKLTKPPLNL